MRNPFASLATNKKYYPISRRRGQDESLRTPPRTPEAVGDNDREEILLRSPGHYGPDAATREAELLCLHLEKRELEKLKELEKLTARTGMPITQENGQRRYGPPLDWDSTAVPPRGCEVFVGKLPRDCYEPELVPIFEKAGNIYEMRLMLDFSGTNRGYCFVHYCTPEEANRAIRELNNYEIRLGRRLGVVKSIDNCRLFIGDIPIDKIPDDIHKEIDKLTDGLVNVFVSPPPPGLPGMNPGFAFVEFESHKAAAMAKRKLVSGKVQMWGVDVAVDWADADGMLH